MYILGISALYHDSAAALVGDGQIIAAAQEERFTRKKHDANIPVNAIKYCLREGNINPEELQYVVYYDNPYLTLDRYMKSMLVAEVDVEDILKSGFHKMFGCKMWIQELLKKELPSIGDKTQFLVLKHHISHAASAFYPSPFQESIILTVDGVGE